jgi:hypothetical protein
LNFLKIGFSVPFDGIERIVRKIFGKSNGCEIHHKSFQFSKFAQLSRTQGKGNSIFGKVILIEIWNKI